MYDYYTGLVAHVLLFQVLQNLFIFFALTLLWPATTFWIIKSLHYCLHPCGPAYPDLKNVDVVLGNVRECLCSKLEFAFSSIIKILLVRSGIETNPGPPTTTTTTTWCCTASQQFNRVKRKITEVQGSFQSSVGRDTLTSAVIEIEESGICK